MAHYGSIWKSDSFSLFKASLVNEAIYQTFGLFRRRDLTITLNQFAYLPQVHKFRLHFILSSMQMWKNLCCK